MSKIRAWGSTRRSFLIHSRLPIRYVLTYCWHATNFSSPSTPLTIIQCIGFVTDISLQINKTLKFTMYFSVVFTMTICIFQTVLATDLCNDSSWYDIQTAKCTPCKECRAKSWVMEPCNRFKDTLCVDLNLIARSIAKNIEEGARNDVSHHKWHEMEGQAPMAEQLEKSTITKSSFMDFENQWGRTFMVVLGITIMTLFVAVFILVARFAKRFSRYDNRKTVARARLFSRDRLNTTEYMNNLATLDRRLAMDEILEKRKRAIFEPQLLNENLYTDEVFVDISGIPRNLQDDHEYEELDHRRCLLRMQEQQ